MGISFDRIYDFAWPDFRVYNEADLSRYLMWSLGLFVPLFAYYAAAAALLASATEPWVALAYAPHLAAIAFIGVFVSLLGTRAGGCVLEIVALVSFKLSFWQLFLGGSMLQIVISGLFLWYSTNLARACFALANERYNAHW